MINFYNKKGFTLAELLIVIAIIGILSGIVVPVFSSRTEKAKEAVDLANVRSAYAEVMKAASFDEKLASNADGVKYAEGRWYVSVPLTQQTYDWQLGEDIKIAGVGPENARNWTGKPSPQGTCLVSYSEEQGVVFAWEYNFSFIMNDIKVKEGTYKNSNILSLFSKYKFPMVESSGGTGNLFTEAIRHELGLGKSDNFAYKILPANEYGTNCYKIYISEDCSLRTGVAKNQTYLRDVTVTGYIYQINSDGSSKMIKTGTPQVISTYSQGQGNEKFDVDGNQDKCVTISNYAKNTPYDWDAE